MTKYFFLPAISTKGVSVFSVVIVVLVVGVPVYSVVIGLLPLVILLVVGVPVYSVVDSLVVSLLGLVSFGSVLLDFIVVIGLAFLAVVVVVVWVNELEHEHKCYELINFSQI